MGIYGDSGVGKTTLAGSADEVPEMRPVLFIDVEGGTESLRNSYPDVETVRVQTWKDVQNVYDALFEGDLKYQTVVLDSLTEIQKFNMYNIMHELTQKKPEADPDIAGMREWGKNIEQMRRFVRAYRDLPMHTIFTALDRVEKNAKTGVSLHMPSMSGKLAGEVAAFLDIVAYYYVKAVGSGDETEYRRLLLTQKTDEYIAKDRSGKLPMVIEYPTMKSLYDLMYNQQTEQTTPETEMEKSA